MAPRSMNAPSLPINGVAAPGSAACRAYRRRAAGLAPSAAALAPGLSPTPSHDLIYRGGKTIGDLTFFNFYVGGAGAWRRDDVSAIDGALAAAMSDPHLNNVMQQYFPAERIRSRFAGSRLLKSPIARGATMTQARIEALVARLHKDGQLGDADMGSTVFNFMLPGGMVLTDDDTPSDDEAARRPLPGMPDETREGADSLHGLGGYHGSIHAPRASGGTETVYYAVGVYSEERPDGTANGIPAFAEPWKNVVATFYHELNEARTDPDVEDAIRLGDDPAALRLLGWTSRQGEECGDFPIFEARRLQQVFVEVPLARGGTVPVQLQYSNAAHGPEGPVLVPRGPALIAADGAALRELG